MGQDIIPTLLEEFPFLYLSTETLRRLWQQSSTQVERLSKAAQEVRSKKSLAQCQVGVDAMLEVQSCAWNRQKETQSLDVFLCALMGGKHC